MKTKLVTVEIGFWTKLVLPKDKALQIADLLGEAVFVKEVPYDLVKLDDAFSGKTMEHETPVILTFNAPQPMEAFDVEDAIRIAKEKAATRNDTDHLNASPANAERLAESIDQLKGERDALH